MEKWFDPTVYMQNKLAQMQATDPAYAMSDLVAAFAKAGFVGPEGYFQHFQQFGAAEEVAPNAYFNANEYYAAKAAQFYGDKFDGSELQIAQVKALINKEGMNAWTHYQQFGSAEGVNPSNAFDASDYCAAKAAAMIKAGQKAPDGTDWTAEKIAKAIDDAGMSVLEHYLTYAGTGEGEVAAGSTYPVADDDQVLVPSGKTIVIDEDDSTIAYTGSAGDDKFYLKDSTTYLHEYNTLDGGEGNDTLILDDKDLGGATIRNIENLVVSNGSGNTYDLSAFSTSFTLEKVGAKVTVDNVTDQKLVVSSCALDVPSPSLIVNMAAGQASVDLASQNCATGHNHTFELKGDSLTSVKLAVDEGAAEVDFANSTNKVTDLAVTATVSEAENDKATVNATALTNLANVTVAGDGAVQLTVAASNKLKAVNAAENTGGVTVDLSEADNAAFTGGAGADTLTVNGSKVAHTLGASDDTVVVKNTTDLVKGFSVDGGEGTDTLSMVSAVATASEMTADVFNKTFTNFEELTISDKLADNLDIRGYTGIDHLTLSGADAAKTINMQSGNTLELTAGAEGKGTYAGTLTVSVADAADGKADVLNIALTGDKGVDGKTITVADVETINVVATDTDLSNGAAKHILSLEADVATTVTVSGDADLMLSGTFAAGATIDISANTADVTFDAGKIDSSKMTDETTLTTLKGFTAGDAIKIAGGAQTDVLSAKMELGYNWDIAQCLSKAVENSGAAWFEFNNNTYVFFSADTALNADDVIVKLAGTGYDLEGLNLSDSVLTLA